MIRHLSVRHKVAAIAVMTTTIVLLLASGLFVMLEISNYRRALVQELTAIAQISGSNSTAAIIFDDRAAAQETLSALSVRPNIEAAAIYTPDGRLFARQTAPAAASSAMHVPAEFAELSLNSQAPYQLVWTRNSVDLYGPIGFDGEVVGVIHILSNLDQIEATIWTYLSAVMVIVWLAIALAWLLASLLQKQVTQPIFPCWTWLARSRASAITRCVCKRIATTIWARWSMDLTPCWRRPRPTKSN